MSATRITQILTAQGSAQKARVLARFFKTGKGEYGEGDVFLGVVVPDVRKVAKAHYQQVNLVCIDQLIKSTYHEVRLCALIMLVYQYAKAQSQEPFDLAQGKLRAEIYDFYLSHTKYINNWDLVDLTAPNIVGDFLLRECSPHADIHLTQMTRARAKQNRMDGLRHKQNAVIRGVPPNILIQLSRSHALWERRISILATFAFIRAGRHQETFSIAEILLHDKHDLIHKAVGWMLREVGKRIDEATLREFLDKHAKTMPRTTLRYAIEHLDETERKHYMNLKLA